MPAGLQVLVKLSPSVRRWCKSMIRLIDMITIQDSKNANRNPPRAYLPVFPETDSALLAALLLIKDRLTAVLNPVRGDP